MHALLLAVAIAATPNAGGQAERSAFDWSQKWHGQKLAIDIISRGRALKGEHFDSKINRLAEHPWNHIQTLLGAYLIASLDELAAKTSDKGKVERFAVETCGSVMTMLSTHQQLYEGHVVYQLDDWRQGDPLWQQVWRTPQLASAIWHITPEQAQKLEELCGFERRRITLPPYYNNPEAEFREEELLFKKKLNAKQLRRLLKQSLPIMTAEQQREVAAILKRFNTRIEAVGASPGSR